MFLWKRILLSPFSLLIWLFKRRSSKIHGNAVWMDTMTKSWFLNRKNTGWVIDGINRLVESESFNLLYEAPTRGGKSSCFSIPNVKALQDESAVITDPSGEIQDKTEEELRAKGYNIITIDVEQIQDRYNPILQAEDYKSLSFLADMLARASGISLKDFWPKRGRQLLNILLRATNGEEFEHRPECQTFEQIFDWVYMIGNPEKEKDLIEIMRRNLDDRSFSAFEAFINKNSEYKDSVVVSTEDILDMIFNDPTFSDLMSDTTFKFSDLREKKTVIFLKVPEDKMEYYSFFITIFYYQLFIYCMEMPKEEAHRKILFILDEFGQMDALPGFTNMITAIAKRNVKIALIVQDFAQIVEKYGKDKAKTIRSNCARLYLTGIASETAEALSKELGTQTVFYDQSSYVDSFRGEEEKSRPLMYPHEIQRMPKFHGILTHSRFDPVKLKMTPYYKRKI